MTSAQKYVVTGGLFLVALALASGAVGLGIAPLVGVGLAALFTWTSLWRKVGLGWSLLVYAVVFYGVAFLSGNLVYSPTSGNFGAQLFTALGMNANAFLLVTILLGYGFFVATWFACVYLGGGRGKGGY